VANLAVALVRTKGGWKGSEVPLEDVDDLDTLADLLRELDGADSSTAVLCFVEEDDEWFAIVRLAGDDDPRVFLSDRRMTDQSELAERLFADAMPIPPPRSEEEEEEEEESVRPVSEPSGDVEILDDLQTNAEALLELVAEEGLLPSDVVAAICERAGATDALEEVRG
jgi:putative tRNA adenosine deaminase-associated protein